MNTEFTLNVRVTLDATPALAALFGHLAPAPQSAQEAAVQPAKGGGSTSLNRHLDQDGAEAQEANSPKPQIPELPEPEPEEPKPDGRPLDKTDIRRAIERARMRIEGEDFASNPQSEIYKKYHKPLRDEFIRIAQELGAEKPTLLSGQDAIAAFIRQCDALGVDETGKIVTEIPF